MDDTQATHGKLGDKTPTVAESIRTKFEAGWLIPASEEEFKAYLDMGTQPELRPTIDTNRILAVLLADGWHNVTDCGFNVQTFQLADDSGAIEYSRGGAIWDESDTPGGKIGNNCTVACPLTSILAVKL